MTTTAERRFVNLRKRLDQLGYRQPLGVESLPLVEKLFSDLVHTTESLRSAKLSAGKNEKECSDYDAILEPYKTENAKLTRENNELHLELLKLKEQSDRHVQDLKASLRRVERENADLKFLNNQYGHKIKMLEKENKARTEKIEQLQEKNLQAVVETPGGRKRSIPFRRQRMQIDQLVPPSGVSAYPVPQPADPYIADLLQVADNRIHELQSEVTELQEKLELSEREMKNYSKQVELRDKEIERLVLALDGGRSHEALSLESRTKSNEKLIADLHLQKEIERRQGETQELEETIIRLKSSEDLKLIIRERDELRSMLDRFEKHMIEIQSNVKLLTAERDRLNVLYEQSQDELNRMRKEAKHNLVSQRHVEEERDVALTDFRRLMAEKESLREKLKIQQEAANLEKSKMQHDILELENNIQGFEMERCELKTTVSILKERINSLENELKLKSGKLAQTSDDSSQFKAEICSLQLLNDQLQRSVEDLQHRLSIKKDELQSAQEEIVKLEEKIDRLNQRSTSQDEAVNVLRSTITVLDKEKDSLQETVDEKTERIACLDDNLANKEKTIAHLCLTLSELESSTDQMKDMLSNRDREISSLHRQLDTFHVELAETGRVKEIALKENRRLQDDLATMARENQAISTELEDAIREKEEMKTRVHNYITEVSRFETLMASKEKENQELLEKFRMLHTQAEDWEMKAHQAEGESSSIRLELLSVDTDRRHLQERVELLEKEIQGHIVAHQAYESQISSITKNMSVLEEDIKRENQDKSSVLADLASVRELCVKLESNKELLSRQLTSKSMDYERVLGELEDIKSEAELLKKQLSSERLTVQNLEMLLATSRDKEFQNRLTSHEKDSEIQLLKDKLTLAESKLSSCNREVPILRSKVAQLQTDCDVLKRQLTTERFERERAIQEMRRHGLSTSSLRASSPLSSTLRSPSHSPERTVLRTADQAAAEKNVTFKE
ncbi:centrosomal protein of 135 kDa isoform X10 [Falco biarmicus]|uniref:centrosomal protein of 135 kDa isoform X10 n=1 Tax=Falco cherrug TaxID=345164 RepID=UPI000FFC14F5|nr:centrosomal protein of 135 kDa isoform X10 [Falco cherrug]XP_037238623.1 centrosomal protein of 135 kDa isoform X10 [Falco rusticolus]XP_056188166.1 centrosomal protein of 135 kDa isoform X10 [Falco biarmicus]